MLGSGLYSLNYNSYPYHLFLLPYQVSMTRTLPYVSPKAKMIRDAFVEDETAVYAQFDVDAEMGFMPPKEPLSRLLPEWEPWELILEAAIESQIQLGDKLGLTEDEKSASEAWRARVRKVGMFSAPTRASV